MTALIPPETRVWLLASGKIGHEVNCRGVLAELGLTPIVKPITPRRLFAALAPYGPIDPRDAAHRAGSPFDPPFPDLVIASGRVTVPYLRYLKRASGGRIFTAFMQDPRWARRACDLIWVPEHDALRGPNVLVTLTSPHHLRPAVLAAARANPDPRLESLTSPRLAMVLGGPSGTHRFEAGDIAALVAAAQTAVASGTSVMVTPSRRTPPELIQALRAGLASAKPAQVFIWDGTGDNPYVQMLALADALLVTGDSVNMLGEAVSTGTPVHVYEPSGGSPKMTQFLDRLVAAGAARHWAGKLEAWDYAPIDATAQIAATLTRLYAAHRARMSTSPSP